MQPIVNRIGHGDVAAGMLHMQNGDATTGDSGPIAVARQFFMCHQVGRGHATVRLAVHTVASEAEAAGAALPLLLGAHNITAERHDDQQEQAHNHAKHAQHAVVPAGLGEGKSLHCDADWDRGAPWRYTRIRGNSNQVDRGLVQTLQLLRAHVDVSRCIDFKETRMLTAQRQLQLVVAISIRRLHLAN